MMRSQGGTKNFHVPLPNEIYAELRLAADHLKLPATQLARQAIESWLIEAKKQSIQKEIEAYAEAMAGTSADLDPSLESAGIDLLLTEGKAKLKKKKIS